MTREEAYEKYVQELVDSAPPLPAEAVALLTHLQREWRALVAAAVTP